MFYCTVTVPYFYYNLISLCLSSFMCHAMSVVYNANPNAIITFGEKTVMVMLFYIPHFLYVYIYSNAVYTQQMNHEIAQRPNQHTGNSMPYSLR